MILSEPFMSGTGAIFATVTSPALEARTRKRSMILLVYSQLPIAPFPKRASAGSSVRSGA